MKKLLLAAMLCASCSIMPTKAQLAAADYGTPIAQEVAETKATAWLQTALKDPDSLRASWGPIKQGWQRDNLFGKAVYGYRLTGDINARNGFGGYTGAQGYIFMFRDGTLVGAWQGLQRVK